MSEEYKKQIAIMFLCIIVFGVVNFFIISKIKRKETKDVIKILAPISFFEALIFILLFVFVILKK